MPYTPDRKQPKDFERNITALKPLGSACLRGRWRELYRTEPPPRISRELLLLAIAYRLQEGAFGGLNPPTRRLLDRVAQDAAASRSSRLKPPTKASVGTVLVREWKGASHQVTVAADGVLHLGTRYRSLSEVARLITGSRWSGPLFFGLRGRSKESAHGTR